MRSWRAVLPVLITCLNLFQSHITHSSAPKTLCCRPLSPVHMVSWKVVLLLQHSSNLSTHQNHLVSLLKHRFLGPIPRISDLVGLVNGWEFSFLTSYQAMLMLLVHSENYCSILTSWLVGKWLCRINIVSFISSWISGK